MDVMVVGERCLEAESTIEVLFEDKKLERACATRRALSRRFGTLAQLVARRLTSLRVASCLADLRNVPGRFEQLRADRKGQFSMRIDDQVRVVFEIADFPLPYLESGDLDLARVTSVRILEVVDYHGS